MIVTDDPETVSDPPEDRTSLWPIVVVMLIAAVMGYCGIVLPGAH